MTVRTTASLLTLRLALAATTAGQPALAADPGDYDVLGEDPGISLDRPVDSGAPITDVTSPEARTSTTIDVDVGEAPDYEMTVEDTDDIPDVGMDEYDVDVGDMGIIEDRGLGTAEELGAPRVDMDGGGQIGEAPSDLLDTGVDDTILDRPDVDEVPELGVTDREHDPIAPDVDVQDERRGFEN